MGLFRKENTKVVLVVLDGVGVAPPGPGNAVTLANTPNLDKYWQKYPHTVLKAYGKYVGLPQDADGNSEIGHLTMGAGRAILQDLPRIDNAIQMGSFSTNPEFLAAIDHAKKNNGAVHLMGLVGNGLVHSSLEHLFALIDLLDSQKFTPDRVYLHAVLDGRDSSFDAGARILKKIDAYMDSKRLGRIVSFIGRYYAKDRDERWERTKTAYEMMTMGVGTKVNNYEEVLQKFYQKGQSDEYIPAHILNDFGGSQVKVEEGDSIINFDFRPDRAVQITKAFTSDNFNGFQRVKIKNLYYVGMTDYGDGLPEHIAIPRGKVIGCLGQILSTNRKTQLRIAESEKFPHVTYFFDGENETDYEGIDQAEVPSNKSVTTYDQDPDMKMKEVVDAYISLDRTKNYDFSLINLAAPDMVSHTGVLEASVKAMEATDLELGRIIEYGIEKGALVLVTADHGNCETMVDPETGGPHTAHTTNPVPVVMFGGPDGVRLRDGLLSDLAPTLLELMGLQQPKEMTGKPLF